MNSEKFEAKIMNRMEKFYQKCSWDSKEQICYWDFGTSTYREQYLYFYRWLIFIRRANNKIIY